MLSKITLIIPTYNREGYVHRLLSYHQNSVGLKIILADGSTQEHLDKNRQHIKQFTNSGLEVMHFVPSDPPYARPGLETPVGFCTRVANAIKLNDRPFVQLSADDDFVSPQFLANAAAFMHANPDYSAVLGYRCNVHQQGNTATGKVDHFDLPPYTVRQLKAETALERIARGAARIILPALDFTAVRQDVALAYADALKALVAVGSDPTPGADDKALNFSLMWLYSSLADFTTLAMGNVHHIKNLQLCFNLHFGNWSWQAKEVNQRTLVDSVLSPEWSGLCRIVIDSVATVLCRDPAMTRQAAERLLQGALGRRVAHEMAPHALKHLGECGADLSEMRAPSHPLKEKLRSIRPLLLLYRKMRPQRSNPEISLAEAPDAQGVSDFLTAYTLQYGTE